MDKAAERRKHPRLPLRLAAIVRRQGGSEAFDAQTENMSCDGICLRSTEFFALGELIEVRLDLDGILGRRHSGLTCYGRVVQAESDGPGTPFRYGCQILDYALQPAVANVPGVEAAHASVTTG